MKKLGLALLAMALIIPTVFCIGYKTGKDVHMIALTYSAIDNGMSREAAVLFSVDVLRIADEKKYDISKIIYLK